MSRALMLMACLMAAVVLATAEEAERPKLMKPIIIGGKQTRMRGVHPLTGMSHYRLSLSSPVMSCHVMSCHVMSCHDMM